MIIIPRVVLLVLLPLVSTRPTPLFPPSLILRGRGRLRRPTTPVKFRILSLRLRTLLRLLVPVARTHVLPFKFLKFPILVFIQVVSVSETSGCRLPIIIGCSPGGPESESCLNFCLIRSIFGLTLGRRVRGWLFVDVLVVLGSLR